MCSSREFDVSFPRKYIQNLGFKTHKVKKGQEWCNYCHLEKMCSKKPDISNEHSLIIPLFFFQDAGILGI